MPDPNAREVVLTCYCIQAKQLMDFVYKNVQAGYF